MIYYDVIQAASKNGACFSLLGQAAPRHLLCTIL